MVSISDDKHDIISSLEKELSENEIVIVTGGLGPTKDDITKIEYAKIGSGSFNGLFQQIFSFAIRLNDKKSSLKDYRYLASAYAKQIALDIIQNANIF